MGYPRKAAMLVIRVSKLLFLLCADNMIMVSAFANQGSTSVLAQLICLKAHRELNVSGPWILIKGLLRGLFVCHSALGPGVHPTSKGCCPALITQFHGPAFAWRGFHALETCAWAGQRRRRGEGQCQRLDRSFTHPGLVVVFMLPSFGGFELTSPFPTRKTLQGNPTSPLHSSASVTSNPAFKTRLVLLLEALNIAIVY